MKIDFRYIREMTFYFSVTNFFMILLIRYAYPQSTLGELIIVSLFADFMAINFVRLTNAA